MTEIELLTSTIGWYLFWIFIILWYFLNGIKSNLEKIANSLEKLQEKTKQVKS